MARHRVAPVDSDTASPLHVNGMAVPACLTKSGE
jgi:hypothetical protein